MFTKITSVRGNARAIYLCKLISWKTCHTVATDFTKKRVRLMILAAVAIFKFEMNLEINFLKNQTWNVTVTH